MKNSILKISAKTAPQDNESTEGSMRVFGRPSFHIEAFSGLRGVSALGVVFTHAMFGDGAKNFLAGYNGLTEIGHVAVVFFFVLSAFLLTLRALGDRQQPKDAKYITWSKNGIRVPYISFRWLNFFIRRVFRIYPCYLFALLLAGAVPKFNFYYASFRDGSPFTWNKIFQYLVGYDVNSIFWTIPPEFEYYLCLPVMLVLYEIAERRDKTGKWIMSPYQADPEWYPYGFGELEARLDRSMQKGFLGRLSLSAYTCFCRLFMVAVLTVVCMYAIPLMWANRGPENYFHVPPFMGRFWCGSLAAICFHMCAQYGFYVPADYKKSQGMSPKTAHAVQVICDMMCWLIVAVMVASFPWYQRLLLQRDIPEDPNWYANNMGSIPEALSAVLVFALSFGCRSGTFARFFSWSFFTWAGEISFPLYLIHPIFVWVIALEMKVTKIDGLLFLIGACIAASTLVHILVEKRGITFGSNLGRYIKARYFNKDPTPPADIEKFEDSEIDKYRKVGMGFADVSAYGGDTPSFASEPGSRISLMRLPGAAGSRRTLVNFTPDEIRDVVDSYQASSSQAVRGSPELDSHFIPHVELPWDADDDRRSLVGNRPAPAVLSNVAIRR